MIHDKNIHCRTEWHKLAPHLSNINLAFVQQVFYTVYHRITSYNVCYTKLLRLRRFIQLCQKHGLKFFARIGPWVNGEIRNGGHPDWLVARLGDPKDPFGNSGRGGKLRTMAPEYLAAVDKLYKKLAEQVQGLYWKA